MSMSELGVGVLIVVGGGLLLAGGKWLLTFMTKAIASAIVTAINGQLGLDGIRDNVSTLQTQVKNLQGQLEAILTHPQHDPPVGTPDGF